MGVLFPRILVFYGDGRLVDNVPLPITTRATTITTTATKITTKIIRGRTSIIATIGTVIATRIITGTTIARIARTIIGGITGSHNYGFALIVSKDAATKMTAIDRLLY